MAKQDSRWALIVDNRLLALGVNVPSPAELASLIVDSHHQRRSSEPTCRGPITRPKHLW